MYFSYLVCELVSDDLSDGQFVGGRGLVGVKEEAGLPVGGQTPVLHRTRLEVGDGCQVCNTKRRT